jgi:hypothetical protein
METLPEYLLEEAQTFIPNAPKLNWPAEPVICTYKTITPIMNVPPMLVEPGHSFGILNYASLLGSTDTPINPENLLWLLENRYRRVLPNGGSVMQACTQNKVPRVQSISRDHVHTHARVELSEERFRQIAEAFKELKAKMTTGIIESLATVCEDLSLRDCLKLIQNGLLKLGHVPDADLINYMYNKHC